MELTALGKQLFGRPVRLLTAAWIAQLDRSRFWQGEAVEGVREAGGDTATVTQSAVRDEIERFVLLGMVEPEPENPGDRRRWYQRQPSPLWDVVSTAVEAAKKC